MASRSACCRRRRATARAQSADRAGASSAGAGDGSLGRRRRSACSRANARRSQPRAASWSTSPSTATAADRRLRRAAGDHHRRMSRHRSRRNGARQQRRHRAAARRSARIVPRKGFDVLIEALATLADLPWQLTIAGDRSRDAKAAAQLDADIARHDLAGGSTCSARCRRSVLPRSIPSADLFVLASRFEGYGMAYRRGACARPADCRHHRRRHPGHRAAQRRRAGRAERREGAGPHAADADRERQRAAVARGRRTDGRERCRPGQDQAKLFAGAIEALA